MIYCLQNRVGLSIAIIPMLVCVVEPSMLPMSLNLYLLFLGSLFYPSRSLRQRLDNPETFTKLCSKRDSILKDYYSR